MSSFIDSGGRSCAIYMVCFSRSIEQRKQFYNCEANSLGVVCCSYNEWRNRSRVRLHGKAAELCLANS